MAITYRPTSTLSAALNEQDVEFNVASTANVTVGCLLVFSRELMKVRAIPVAGRVSVRRGYEGTRSVAHRNGATFFIGTPEQFAQARNAALGLFGEGAKLPDCLIPGAKAIDVDGYEYTLVDVAATGGVIQGSTVGISKDGLYRAIILTTTHSGLVGVITENGTSDQWVWALTKGLYKRAEVTIGGSIATSTGICMAASSVSTPSVGLIVFTTSQASSVYATTSAGLEEYPVIHGMWPASSTTSGTSATTSAHTGIQIDLWLDNPYMNRKLSS
jgi:hypothetical protein